MPAILRCNQGNMFTHSDFTLRKFDDMYEHCPVCRFRYKVEPGFYGRAMYQLWLFRGVSGAGRFVFKLFSPRSSLVGLKRVHSHGSFIIYYFSFPLCPHSYVVFIRQCTIQQIGLILLTAAFCTIFD